MKKPLILTALEMEACAVERQLAGEDFSIEMKVIGIGAVRLPADLSGASLIIMAGLAGALDPALKIGDVVSDETGSRIHTSEKLVSTPDEKARLFRETGAAAVDMENAIVLAKANAAAVPFVGIRAISDTAGESVDPALFKLVDESGKVKPLAAARLFLRRPALLAQARRLQTNSNKALEALGAAVRRFLEDRKERSPSGRG